MPKEQYSYFLTRYYWSLERQTYRDEYENTVRYVVLRNKRPGDLGSRMMSSCDPAELAVSA